MQGEAAGPCMVVTGVGLNVKMPVAEGHAITQPWTDLSHISPEPVSRNHLLAELLNQLLPAMQQYEESGLQSFLPDWRRWDAMAGKQVQLLLPTRTISGRVKGIDDQGNLLLEQDDSVEAFAAGEISLKADSSDSHATAD
jgi:BirA family biotin operon repressor/biotin-[acetyl-CoA-carboxylase] ligase